VAFLHGQLDWWYHLPPDTRYWLRFDPRRELTAEVMQDVEAAARPLPPGDAPVVVADRRRRHLSSAAIRCVEVMDALNRTAQAVSTWDRSDGSARRASARLRLGNGLTSAGVLVQRLRREPLWGQFAARPDATGVYLDEILDGYWWARTAPGGLPVAARLTATDGEDAGTWQSHCWWDSGGALHPAFEAHLASRPAMELIRRILASYAEAAGTAVPAPGLAATR